MEKTQKQNVKF